MATILAVAGQLLLKFKVNQAGSFPSGVENKLFFLFHLYLNPLIIFSLALAFLSNMSWMIAMTKFKISYAYPFTSLSFVFILILSNIFLNEAISIYKIAGTFFIVIGLVIGIQK